MDASNITVSLENGSQGHGGLVAAECDFGVLWPKTHTPKSIAGQNDSIYAGRMSECMFWPYWLNVYDWIKLSHFHHFSSSSCCSLALLQKKYDLFANGFEQLLKKKNGFI